MAVDARPSRRPGALWTSVRQVGSKFFNKAWTWEPGDLTKDLDFWKFEMGIEMGIDI